jgi:hypothetical protein
MRGLAKMIQGHIAVKLLVICLTSFVSISFNGSVPTLVQMVHAASDNPLQAGWESYLNRPDILKVPAQAENLGETWNSLKAAHFSFVAELLALYPPDTHLYFLARDSEHLYDVARLVTDGTVDAQRVHLLNVSRANMRDENVKGYLNENGISEETLTSGKKVLLIDTGYAGTIPRVIGESFSQEARANLKAHLIICNNPTHPSSRAFMVHLNPSVNERELWTMHASIANYEHMPRYTERSNKYVHVNGRYHPMSPMVADRSEEDGAVSKTESLRYMRDLKSEWQKDSTKANFQAERNRFKRIKNVLMDPTKKGAVALKTWLQKASVLQARTMEAQIRDVFEIQANARFNLSARLEDLELEPITENSAKKASVSDLIKKFPEWASVLSDPESEIPELFNKKDWQMIGNLIDAQLPSHILEVLADSLFAAPTKGVKKSLKMLFVQNVKPEFISYIATLSFKGLSFKDTTDILTIMIERGDTWSLKVIKAYLFPSNYVRTPERDTLKQAIEIEHPEQRKLWIESEFKKITVSQVVRCEMLF